MLGLASALVSLGTFAWAIFDPAHGSWFFVALEAALLSAAELASRLPRPPRLGADWTAEEAEVCRRCYAALLAPAAWSARARSLLRVAIAGLLTVPWLLWRGATMPALLLVAMFFLAGRTTRRLDPEAFLRREFVGDWITAAHDLLVFERVVFKLARDQARVQPPRARAAR